MATVGIDGPGTETSDSILAKLSKNESVINAGMTTKHRHALEAINNDQFQQYLLKYEMPRMHEQFSMPVVPKELARQVEDRRSWGSRPEIDYEKLGEVIASKLAKELANNPQVSVNLDENGFNVSVQRGLETLDYIK